MTQANREKLAQHFKKIGIPDSENPYSKDLKEVSEITPEETLDAEVEVKPKKRGKQTW